MFTLKTVISPRVIYTVSQNFVRHARKDPGIRLRKKLISNVGDKDLELPDFDDLESDFMDVHKSHKEHQREMSAVKEREKYHIVRQKYFKENFPNFLTWYDKEQIRYLYRTDPEEWTIEKLSEGFPALPETIKKIVKSNWIKDKQHKIINHDKSVQKNWELFKKGQIPNLSSDLVEHLKKFTNRTLNFNVSVSTEARKHTFEVRNKNMGTEFSEIITSYEKMKRKDTPQIEERLVVTEDLPKQPLKETYVTTKSRASPVTLGRLQEKLKNKIETGKDVNDDEKLIVMNIQSKPSKVEKISNDEMKEVVENKYQSSTAVQIHKKPEREVSHLNYPEKISIPKAIFKKGFIYKLNDCYYDDDGEFLYRVPGMG